MGECPNCLIGGIVGAGVEYLTQVVSNLASGKDLKSSVASQNINYTKVIIAGVTGFATGGVSTLAMTGTEKLLVASLTVASGSTLKQATEKEGVDPVKIVTDVVSEGVAGNLAKSASEMLKPEIKNATNAIATSTSNSTIRLANSNLKLASNLNNVSGVATSGSIGNAIEAVVDKGRLINLNLSNPKETLPQFKPNFIPTQDGTRNNKVLPVKN